MAGVTQATVANSAIVCYCDGTECDLSHTLAEHLRQNGFKNIHILAGTITYADQIWWIAVLGVVASAAYAFYIKANNREKYDLIGRVIDEGIVP